MLKDNERNSASDTISKSEVEISYLFDELKSLTNEFFNLKESYHVQVKKLLSKSKCKI